MCIVVKLCYSLVVLPSSAFNYEWPSLSWLIQVKTVIIPHCENNKLDESFMADSWQAENRDSCFCSLKYFWRLVMCSAQLLKERRGLQICHGHPLRKRTILLQMTIFTGTEAHMLNTFRKCCQRLSDKP